MNRSEKPVGTAVVLDAGASTDVGLKRKANEDSYLASYPVFAVADGMGGHDAGDRASQAVVEQLAVLVGVVNVEPGTLAGILDEAHRAVSLIADETERGAGSTLTGVVVTVRDGQPNWLVFNIGDSRVYRLFDGELSQLTVDHSLVQQLIDEGTLPESERSTFAGRNVITRAVGADDSDADYWLYPILHNERLLLCSDGLSGEVTDEAIRSILLSTRGAQAAADALLQRALENGGRDNVTVLVLDVVAGGVTELADEETLVRVAPEPDPAGGLDANTLEIPRAR